jgi:hypothetical protein
MILAAMDGPRACVSRRLAPNRLGILSAALIATSVWTCAAHAAPTLGFIEEWPGISLSGWLGATNADNPGSGGVAGAGDGFLRLSSAAPAQFGIFSTGAEYTGDWQVAGITHVIISLNNLGTPDPIEIHFGIGRDAHDLSPNFWQYDIGFIPPVGTWQAFDVDLSSANFTRIFGPGTSTLAGALTDVKKIHFRHDLAPYAQLPDSVAGDVGLDRLVLSNVSLSVEPSARFAARQPVALAPPAPNPSRGRVVLSLETFEGGPVHLQIVDAGGRLLRRAELADGPAGGRSWTWDGTDDRGRALAPGVYRVRAWGPSGGTSRPLIRVR